MGNTCLKKTNHCNDCNDNQHKIISLINNIEGLKAEIECLNIQIQMLQDKLMIRNILMNVN